MISEEIKKIIQKGESQTTEFKKSTTQLNPTCETICGFLNSSGGIVLLGVSNDGHILGQEVTDSTKRALGNEIAKISPVANITINYIDIRDSNKTVIAIQSMSESNKKPYTYDGKAYLRVETNTIPMPQEHYNYFLSAHLHQKFQSWEDIVVTSANIDDLDHNEILSTIKEGILNGRIPEEFATNDVQQALHHFKLIHNGNLTAAAIILFAKNPEKWFSQCLLKLARFRGKSHLDDFIDNKQIHGNVFKIISEAMTFANRYLPIASYFPKDSLERKDVPLFPIKALREVFANAVCHRDYSFTGGSISFAIFDDRLEIWSYGLFPPGVSGQEIKNLHKSVPRNPKIANILYYRKIIESWGRGIDMIVNECVNAGHPEPSFSQNSVGVKVTLPSKELLGPFIATQEETLQHLTRRQQEIVHFVKNRGETTLGEIIAHLTDPPAERTLQAELAKLKEMGMLDTRGFGRGSKWVPTTEKKTQKDAERRK